MQQFIQLIKTIISIHLLIVTIKNWDQQVLKIYRLIAVVLIGQLVYLTI